MTISAADPLAPLMTLPGVPEAAAEAAGAVDRLRAHRVLRRAGAAVSAESALRGARASAALEGVEHELGVVRAGGGGPVVRGALRAAGEVGALAEMWSRAPAQVLARLHLLAAYELAEPETLGRASGSARLSALGELLTGRSAAPAVVLAAVVHGELLALVPFATGNGVVARAAARLTLVSRGLDPRALSVPEVGHAELAGEYAALAAGYRAGGSVAVAAWLRHGCAAVVLGAREGLAICESTARGSA